MGSWITGKTTLLGLFGSPVEHSVSPVMHNTAFEALGLDFAYLAFEIGTDDAGKAVEALRTFRMRGANVTMPLKAAVVPYLDQLTPAAQLIGAVNTIINDNGVLTGHITDGEGYMMSVRDAGLDPAGKKMTLAGAGGAAKAICVQAALDGVKELSIFNRNREKAEQLAELINQNTGCRAKAFGLDEREALRRELSESCLFANATRVGMAQMEGQSVIPETDFLHSGLAVTDAIYEPEKTRLLQMAEEAGCRTLNGLGMVLFQGAAAFRLWTGREMPVELVRKKLFQK